MASLEAEQEERQHQRQQMDISRMLTESDGLTSELVDLLIDKIYVYPDKRVDVEFKIRASLAAHKCGKGIDYADCVLLQKRQHNFWLYAAGRKGTASCFFCRRTETGGGKIPIKKAGSWGQEKINIFLSWA